MVPGRILLLLIVAFIATACGGDDNGSDSGNTNAGGSVPATSALQSCLTEAGLEVKTEDTKAFGVEDSHDHLEVPLESEAFDKDYAVDLWVFETSEAAEGARTAITLSNEDDERGKVLGSVVVHYEIVPDQEDTKQVEACIEG
jgi:hypothetical protein